GALRAQGDAGSRALPRSFSIGFQRSPWVRRRSGTFSMRKSAISTWWTCSHVTGVETLASGWGRTAYTEASGRPQAFWLESIRTRSAGRGDRRYSAVARDSFAATASENAFAKRHTAFCSGPRTIGT